MTTNFPETTDNPEAIGRRVGLAKANPQIGRGSILRSSFVARSPETAVILNAIRFYVRRMFRPDWLPQWYSDAVKIEAKPQLGDLATAFFIHAALSSASKTVVEIGAYSGKRILEIKRKMPHISCYALDVGETYKSSFVEGDVTFRPFDLKFFSTDLDAPIVICNGVLHYMSREELTAFVEVLAARKISLAFFEPTLSVNFGQKSIPRRKGHHGWYHPYDEVLTKAGFTLTVKDNGLRSGHTESCKTLERYVYDFAVPR
jgi:hypothetical protein